MKQFYLKVKAKNTKSLNFFLFFIFSFLKIKLNIFQKTSKTFKNWKMFTFLTSPHVNKAAQEHFEVRVFLKKLDIKSFCYNQNVLFLKKIISKLFYDISICLKLITNIYKKNTYTLLLFYPDKFKFVRLKTFQKNFKRNKQKLVTFKKCNFTSFLNTQSIFGEILIRLP